MPTLLADRFMPAGASWIDLATGATVRVRVAPARTGSDGFAWNDWCAALATMRHPLLNVLLDWGSVDAARTFEAYTIAPPLAAGGAAGSRLLTHAARFFAARGVHLDPEAARLSLRAVGRGTGRPRRPLGIVLQPRRALSALEEALDEVVPGGAVLLTVTGARGSGLRTACLQAARLARMRGYVPVSAAVLAAAPWIADALRARHVCVLLCDRAPASAAAAAALSARLGVSSARRHAIIRFERRAAGGCAIALEPLGVTAMMSMVFADSDFGPGEEELLAAARRADGLPGRFLAGLRASALPASRATFEVVHETSPAYVVDRRGPERARPCSRSLASAGLRAERLARRGRHASAIRLLTRASRVLERRGEPRLAARCAEQLGWILRERGRTQAALEQFARAAALAAGSPEEVSAAIATGVTWTDECRFTEAEAAIRGSLAAAELLEAGPLQGAARLALARVLYWQRRHDEAGPVLAPAFTLLEGGPLARAHALAARIACARGDVARAVQCASTALAYADERDARTVAAVARAMAEARIALGDDVAARACLRQGLQAAASAHAPLAALRLRALAAALRPGSAGEFRRRTPAHWTNGAGAIPPLLRRQLQKSPNGIGDAGVPRADAAPAIPALERFLAATFSAADDRDGIETVCRDLCARLRAATVQVLTHDADRRLLARAGRPWSGDLRVAERALAGAARPVFGDRQPVEAAQAISFAGEAIAVIGCRWTMTAAFDRDAAAALLRSAALALAPAVRALCDRATTAPPEQAWRDLIGTSTAALALRDAITRAARAPFPVLIEGESGSGKEIVARAIHRFSARRDRRLCTINCAAISDDLLEAELFGHARGAFTGAVGDRPGLFEEADAGTLFLDEVGELSPRAQAKLLRVLQDGEVRRVGENAPRRVDARVIAATNRRLDAEVESGRFRADLRFRLDVVRIQVPPLRDRPLDVPLLAAHFWEEAARRVGSRAVLAPDTLQALARYDWPGNVRQLQNVIATLAVQAPRRGRVPPSLLPRQVARTAADGAATFEAARAEFERRYVAAELARAGGHRTRAARALGVTRQGLAKMMRRLGIDG